MNDFREGVFVEWTSQAAGIVKRKFGEIVRVVPARHHPDIKGAGGWRDHESYIVRVRQHDGIGKVTRSRLYWPRVSALKAVET